MRVASPSRIRFAIAAIAALGLALAVASCGGGGGGNGDGPGAQGLDLTIGAPVPAGDIGDSGRKASDLALKQIQDSIDATASEHRVDVVDRNQGAGQDAAADATEHLVESDH